ncbi:helix-hairpin-helix domain-containing protein [Catelliglobosispora koreensis]|uniref:helix-hairpin-helix domain-containing protein n=1 Tax=Catelliglobosispora koreensis TaxID=129052 RepID=UPI000380B434|nr:helix-hairpin-helix domain-containing protein [Catelliglobosispora koreensis]
MTTFAQLRKTALSLPEAAEQRNDEGMSRFTVSGKTFAALAEGNIVRLHVADADADAVLAEHPTAQRLTAAAGVQVPLADINGQQLNHWVRRAWLWHAPKRLASQAAAADAAVPGAVGDLPKAIGKPATQALVNAGITTLDELANITEEQLKAMHGMGPKAIRLLGEALVASGRSLKS